MLRGRQAWQLPSRWRLHSHWRTHVSADLLKAFDNTCPERHGLIRWRCISSARAGLILTIVTAHQPVTRWLAPTEVFTLLCWSRSTSGDFGKLISKSLERAKSFVGFQSRAPMRPFRLRRRMRSTFRSTYTAPNSPDISNPVRPHTQQRSQFPTRRPPHIPTPGEILLTVMREFDAETTRI